MASQERPAFRAFLTRDSSVRPTSLCSSAAVCNASAGPLPLMDATSDFMRSTPVRQHQLTAVAPSSFIDNLKAQEGDCGSFGEIAPGLNPRAEDHFGGMSGKGLRGQTSLRKTRGTHTELMEIWMAGSTRKNRSNDASCLMAAKTQPQGSRRPKGSQWQECSNCLSMQNQPSGSG